MMNDELLPPVPRGTILSEAWRYFTLCLNKENFARLQGRAGRAEYWSVTLIGSIFCLLPLSLVIIPYFGLLFLLIDFLIIIYLAMPMLAVFVRRLHDVNCPGWTLIPYYFLVAIYTFCAVFQITQLFLDFGYTVEPIDILTVTTSSAFLTYASVLINISSLIYLVITLMPGTKGVNKYGNPA